MAISNKKKCQTLINIVVEQVELLKTASAKLQACRQAYIDQSVSPVSTPLDGHVAEISDWIDDVESVADNIIANGFLAYIVPTHSNSALGEI